MSKAHFANADAMPSSAESSRADKPHLQDYKDLK